uniref:Uncharacterized protein n=1 Tax=Caenorhabditis japonica TaxID=281687 RepID=A0A8R1ECS1_CAEJA
MTHAHEQLLGQSGQQVHKTWNNVPTQENYYTRNNSSEPSQCGQYQRSTTPNRATYTEESSNLENSYRHQHQGVEVFPTSDRQTVNFNTDPANVISHAVSTQATNSANQEIIDPVNLIESETQRDISHGYHNQPFDTHVSKIASFMPTLEHSNKQPSNITSQRKQDVQQQYHQSTAPAVPNSTTNSSRIAEQHQASFTSQIRREDLSNSNDINRNDQKGYSQTISSARPPLVDYQPHRDAINPPLTAPTHRNNGESKDRHSRSTVRAENTITRNRGKTPNPQEHTG